jgi:hypothetical protein
VIIEAYPDAVDGKNTQYCNVGFVPSHTSTDCAPVAPVVGHNIRRYGGWWIQVQPTALKPFDANHGWVSLPPGPAAAAAAAAAAGDAPAAADGTSTYATTDRVPPVPAGSAVEFAVDYAAGTCRVAFYTPAAVAGGFAEAPYAKMELRFVASAAEVLPKLGPVPARSVPTAAADSRVQLQLYPAVAVGHAGAVLRLL